jgi:sulfur carrier protein ThiS
MSRISHPSEKVLAIGRITKELIRELGLNPEPVVIAQTTEPVTPEQWRAAMKSGELKVIPTGKPEISWVIPPEVMASLIDAATRIAMGTDTRDLGIMGMEVSQPPRPTGADTDMGFPD